MRLVLYFLFFYFDSINVQAQRSHFVYIQTENRQAFYLKLNDKIYSSSASGYVIITKLKPGDYNLTIGFAKNDWPPQIIDINVNDRDEGFILKKIASAGWGLYDLQNNNLLAGKNASTFTRVPLQSSDAFSNTLAEVTNTASLRQQELKDSISITNAGIAGSLGKAEIKQQNSNGSATATQIVRVFSLLDDAGRSLIYTITNGNAVDSVRLLIPYGNNTGRIEPVDAGIMAQKDSTQNSLSANKKEYKITVINPACKTTATEQDFLSLRKKMAASVKDEDKLAVARKGFKTKCFTTEQIKNLSMLFPGDYGKYNLYDNAYDHISDVDNFKSLQSQLSEEYYINRFRAMLR